MIYHCIRYTIDPQKLADFETYSRALDGRAELSNAAGASRVVIFCRRRVMVARIISRMALIGFESLAAYEEYRKEVGG